MGRSILVIDDDADVAELLQVMLRRHGYQVDHIEECPESVDESRYSAILLDRNLGSVDGLNHIPSLRAMAPSVPIVLLTVEQSVELVVRAIKAGAFDYIAKPPTEERLVATLHRAGEFHQSALERIEHDPHTTGYGEIIGSSPAMRAVYQIIANIAPTDVSVLICGATGTGKELVARTIHEKSSVSKGPFVALNMAGMPAELVESTLFGHEKGSFTGADRTRVGACEEARGGTLFLDEITEMPILLQAKLLRFLQERTIRRVGGTADIKTNLRVLSATNRDPLGAVQSGQLRTDLYYRLNVVPIVLPDLSERVGDVELLSRRFVHKLGKRHGRDFHSIDGDALTALVQYDWPGNVRQLHHVVERMVVTNAGPTLRADMLPDEIRTCLYARKAVSVARAEVSDEPTAPRNGSASQDPPAATETTTVPMKSIVDLERDAIIAAIEHCGGSPARAAKVLGISNATIYRKIKTFGLR